MPFNVQLNYEIYNKNAVLLVLLYQYRRHFLRSYRVGAYQQKNWGAAWCVLR
ncbi:hypothetical protein [Brachyspira pilosicoli]|uniref:hypothetical protein n=1 Tax=Brachyspira pilosicoli TaxID=52584 RepID=UPI001CA59E2C|nr:hypothetical protein [Brachyspira pilosicoli]